MFVGVSLATNPSEDGAISDEMALQFCVAFVTYTVVFCWLVVRNLDRINAFRRFPFRGSFLLGGIAGCTFAVLFVFGLVPAAVLNHNRTMVTEISWRDLVLWLAVTILYATAICALAGFYMGMLAGGIYCGLRHLVPSKSQVVPHSRRPHAWRLEREKRD